MIRSLGWQNTACGREREFSQTGWKLVFTSIHHLLFSLSASPPLPPCPLNSFRFWCKCYMTEMINIPKLKLTTIANVPSIGRLGYLLPEGLSLFFLALLYASADTGRAIYNNELAKTNSEGAFLSAEQQTMCLLYMMFYSLGQERII